MMKLPVVSGRGAIKALSKIGYYVRESSTGMPHNLCEVMRRVLLQHIPNQPLRPLQFFSLPRAYVFILEIKTD